jgi:hypothetical protein
LEAERLDGGPKLGRGANRTERIVLVGLRHTEDGHDRVADELLDRAAVALEDRARLVVVTPHHRADGLRIPLLAERCRAGQVAEEDGHALPDLVPRRHLLAEGRAAGAAEPEADGIRAPAAGAGDHRPPSVSVAAVAFNQPSVRHFQDIQETLDRRHL